MSQKKLSSNSSSETLDSGVSEKDLTSIRQFKALFSRAEKPEYLGELHPETKRSIFILLHRDIEKKKTSSQGVFEFIYTWGGLASGTSVTWNVFGRKVLIEQFGWLDGGYDVYGPGTPADRMALMIALNLHTFPSLYLFNWGQMSEDAHDITSQWKYNRGYNWPETTEDSTCIGSFLRNSAHIPVRLGHSIVETFFRPSMPYTPHWSQSIVMPLAWVYWTLNTIPEVSAIIPVLEETGNWWTGISVPMAILQRIGAQKRRTKKGIDSFYAKTAEWGADEETNKKRKELISALDNASRRIRAYRLSEDELTGTYIKTLFLSVFRKELKESRVYRGDTTGPVAQLASRGGIISRPSGVSLTEESLTDEGILSVFYGIEGPQSKNLRSVDYKEPTSRFILGLVGATIGLSGSISPAIIMDTALQSGFQYLGIDADTSFVLSKLISVPIGMAGGVGRANAAKEYITRVYDAFTAQRHYIESGKPSSSFTDVVFGYQEGPVLISNYFEGIWWDGLLYGALGIPALHYSGIDLPEAGALLLPSIISQGAFAAEEQLDDIETAAHALQRLRKAKRFLSCCDGLLDTVFCCVRGSRRCTVAEYMMGSSKKEIEESIHSYKLLKAMAKEKEGIQMAPSPVIKDKHRMFIEKNPLLTISNITSDEESIGVVAVKTSLPDSKLSVFPGAASSPSKGGTPVLRGRGSIKLLSSFEEAEKRTNKDEEDLIIPYTTPWSCLCRMIGWR